MSEYDLLLKIAERRDVGARTKKQRQKAQADATQKISEALRHPLRSQILTLLGEGVYSATELGRMLDVGTPTVDYHVKRLAKLGFAEEVKKRKVRGVYEHFFRATSLNLTYLAENQALHPAITEHRAGEVLHEATADFLDSCEYGSFDPHGDHQMSHLQMVFDAEGYARGVELLDEAFAQLQEESAASVDRLSKSDETEISASATLLLFKI